MNFPNSSFWGGTLIGLAAALLFFSHGRVMGISNMLSSLFVSHLKKKVVAFFFAGMFLGTWVLLLLTKHTIMEIPTIRSIGDYLLGGFFVGFGTVLSNGCTSGHGICGVSRFSKRSLLATAIFLATGIAVATLYGLFIEAAHI